MDVTVANQKLPSEMVTNTLREEIMIVDDSRETLQFLTKMRIFSINDGIETKDR